MQLDQWEGRGITVNLGENDIYHYKHYHWPGFHLGKFYFEKEPLYTKWFLPPEIKSNIHFIGHIFNEDMKTESIILGGVEQAQK